MHNMLFLLKNTKISMKVPIFDVKMIGIIVLGRICTNNKSQSYQEVPKCVIDFNLSFFFEANHTLILKSKLCFRKEQLKLGKYILDRIQKNSS